MTPDSPSRQAQESSPLATLGWVGVVILGAALALVLLSWLGPVGR